MRNIRRWAVIIVCFGFLATLFGCRKHIVDGPDMENPFVWTQFSVSRSGDSYAQHNFYINVIRSDEYYIVKGTFIGSDDEQSIVLPKSARRQIDELHPEVLPDVVSRPSEIPDDDELIILDVSTVEIEVAYANGTLTRKVDENDFSIKVYEIVYPYFENISN